MEKVKDCDSLTAVSAMLCDLQLFCLSHIIYCTYKDCFKQDFTILQLHNVLQWVGPIEDKEEEFDSIDTNGGGQILFNEFIDWALARDLDIEDDVEPEEE